MVETDLSASAYKEMFWEALSDVPALRFQLIELIEARTVTQLADSWGFASKQKCLNYIRGPLRRRLDRVAGGDAVSFLKKTVASQLRHSSAE